MSQRKSRRRRRPTDLRRHYATADVPPDAHVGVLDLDDPYAAMQHEPDRLIGPKRTKTRAQAPVREWQTPERPRVRVIANLRDDPLGRLFARGQIDEAEFAAGRRYQEVAELAQVSRLRSPGLEFESRGTAGVEPLTDAQRAAVRTLSRIDQVLQATIGAMGLDLVRCVLLSRLTIGHVAEMRGYVTTGKSSLRIREHLGWLFREGLRTLAWPGHANQLGKSPQIPLAKPAGKCLPNV